MEHKKKTLTPDLIIDIEEKQARRNSSFTDDELDDFDEYTEYNYTGTFSICNSICRGIIKLICPYYFTKRNSKN